MTDFGNNPQWADITRLDHLSPQPTFSYVFNAASGVWQPDLSIKEVDGDGGVGSKPWRLVTRTVNQKIEEEFILLEKIPEETRYGSTLQAKNCYGEDKDLMDDIYGTYYANARKDPSAPEIGHPEYFLHPEDIDTGRCVQAKTSDGHIFHTDCEYGFRQEFIGTSRNTFALKDYNELYAAGMVDHVTLVNNSPYPLQVHSQRGSLNEPFYLNDGMSVTINHDEADGVFVKRPHTISGYTVNYSITYKETGVKVIRLAKLPKGAIY